ncbi:hypothetical protein RvY_09466 [Ramazzottius varieornatus]|uniref:Uncharacterized protein n=1 Tax=Ramazzottius varieornatus TaxID=947166 RepID=A0A1D1VE12_RAMVA|nr:hypothetical protein RvY_09466 [Ramazzottius varieornatus]
MAGGVRLGVTGRSIRFRSPKRRNLSTRLENQFLAEAFENSKTREGQYALRKSGELGFLLDQLEQLNEDAVLEDPKRVRKTEGREPLALVDSPADLKKRLTTERKAILATFLETYLHWLRWGDARNLRTEINYRRNQQLEETNNPNFTTARQKSFASDPSVTEGCRPFNEAGELVLHRIITSTRNSIRKSIQKTANRQRSIREAHLKRPLCAPGNFQQLVTYRPAAQLVDSKGQIALGNWRAKQEVDVDPKDYSKALRLPSGSSKREPSCKTTACSAFGDIFAKATALKSEKQKALLSLESISTFHEELMRALTDVSLAKVPQSSNDPRKPKRFASTGTKYMRHSVRVSSEQAEAFTLFDKDVTGVQASVNPDAVNIPDATTPQPEQQDGSHQRMTSEAINKINKKLLKSNWVCTASDDVRLTDFQEWSATLGDVSSLNDGRRRVLWESGPPFFGNIVEQVSENPRAYQAVSNLENVHGLVRAMAEYITQDKVLQKFILSDEKELPKPTFYQSLPPWADYVDENSFVKWISAHN